MSRLAAQSLDLALTRFPPALLPDGGTEALRSVAAWLAPGLQVYFECRLAGDDRSIDVSQHFFAAQGDMARLLTLAEHRADALEGDAATTWRRLAAFARTWLDDPALTDAVAEIGLEHDQGPDGAWVAAPAAFAAFRSDILGDRAAGERFVAAVAPEGREAWRRILDTLDFARANGLTVGRMVGAMLSRDAQLRCMVRGLTASSVRRFLKAAAWPGDPEPLLALIGQPPFRGEATRLVLGFAPTLTADCGVEVIHERGPEGDARRGGLLDWLADRGLADRHRVDALAGWAGAITPPNARAAWPDALILRDLASAEGRLDCFNAFVSHVKLNIVGGRIQPAKAYLALAPIARDMEGRAHV